MIPATRPSGSLVLAPGSPDLCGSAPRGAQRPVHPTRIHPPARLTLVLAPGSGDLSGLGGGVGDSIERGERERMARRLHTLRGGEEHRLGLCFKRFFRSPSPARQFLCRFPWGVLCCVGTRLGSKGCCCGRGGGHFQIPDPVLAVVVVRCAAEAGSSGGTIRVVAVAAAGGRRPRRRTNGLSTSLSQMPQLLPLRPSGASTPSVATKVSSSSLVHITSHKSYK